MCNILAICKRCRSQLKAEIESSVEYGKDNNEQYVLTVKPQIELYKTCDAENMSTTHDNSKVTDYLLVISIKSNV
jgi:hypothetical protein